MLAKKTSKNQLTLPKDVVKSFPGADYFDISVDGGKIVLIPVKIMRADAGLAGIRDKMAKLGITEDDLTGAVAWARKKKR
jgi:hypothetical protein